MFKHLYRHIYNSYAVAGIMGNLKAESGLIAHRKQGDFDSDYIPSALYTDKVDSGAITENEFCYDSIGYGLAQWTFWSRKQALLQYAKDRGKSVGDCETQLDFLVQEMSSEFPSVWSTMLNAKSVREASDSVLLNYEKPANASAQCEYRAGLGEEIYTRCALQSEAEEFPEETADEIVKDIVELVERLRSLVARGSLLVARD